jgi:hypothetical protein
MFKKIVHQLQPSRSIFFLLVAVMVIILGLGVRRAGAASPSHYSILAETMQPLDSSIGYNNVSAYLVTTANSSVAVQTAYVGQVHLPDGAIISAVRVYGIDSDTSQNFLACMYRYNQDAALVYDPVTSCFSTTSSPGKTSLNLPLASTDARTIDNLTYSYSVFIVLPKASVLNVNIPTLGVLRIVIDWSYPSFLPLINK